MKKYGIEYWDEPRSAGAITPKLRLAGARARSKAASGAGGGKRQLVVKVVHWGKTQGQAGRLADYISRNGPQPQRGQPGEQSRYPEAGLTLENDRGELLTGKEAVRAELASWDMLANKENRPAGYDALSEDERTALDPAKAFKRRQYAHMVITLPREYLGQSAAMENAVREALSETFGAGGHRYVHTVHTDTGRPHVHVMVSARSGADHTGRRRQLRLNPEHLDGFRALVAERLAQHGIEVDASRRIDRPELRAAIAQGQAPLRQHQSRQARSFAQAAPAWYAHHGADYEQRRMDPSHEPHEPAPTLTARVLARVGLGELLASPQLPEPATDRQARAFGRLRDHTDALYVRPEAAAARFLEMYQEAPKAAVWAMNNHPQAFGAVRPNAVAPGSFTGRGLNVADKSKDPPHQPSRPKRLVTPPAMRKPTVPELRAAADRRRAARRAEHEQNITPDAMRRSAQDLRRSALGNAEVATAADELDQAARQHPRAARALDRLDAHCRSVFQDPTAARAAFLEAYQFDRRDAIREMNENPATYGAVVRAATAPYTGRGIPRDQIDYERPSPTTATAPAQPAEPDARRRNGLTRLDQYFAEVYAAPAEARATFLRAYETDPKAAVKAANERPEIFGRVTGRPTQPLTARGVPRDQTQREAQLGRTSRHQEKGIDI